MNSPEFIFIPLRADHIELLAGWLRQPHVKEYWQEDDDLQKLSDKFLNLSSRGVSAYIIHLDGAPIGYIQSYEASKVGSGWWPDAQPGLFGIDQFIGIESMVGKGIGTAMIRQFTSDLFENPQVFEIITDPDPINARAIRAYEKVGFVREGAITTPGGAALLMRMKKPKPTA
jgi:RimJ/RimL family protein N-acetyltransferase